MGDNIQYNSPNRFFALHDCFAFALAGLKGANNNNKKNSCSPGYDIVRKDPNTRERHYYF